jgi:hypothetical protein
MFITETVSVLHMTLELCKVKFACSRFKTVGIAVFWFAVAEFRLLGCYIHAYQLMLVLGYFLSLSLLFSHITYFSFSLTRIHYMCGGAIRAVLSCRL